jgi:hypothetical protein
LKVEDNTLIIGDAKKMAQTIVSGMHKPKALEVHVEAHKVEEPEDEKMGLKACAEDMMHAIESKDAEALAMALYDFWSMCEDHEDFDHPEHEAEEAVPPMAMGGMAK